MYKQHCYDTAIGKLFIAEKNGAITHLTFSDNKHPRDVLAGPSELTDRAALQVGEYLAGNRREFDLPLAPEGTDFQRAVWQALCEIPYGETRSYGQIAQRIGNPKACRAVGMANNRNPISIIIPCHRVIGANGALVGYGGGLHIKEHLLHLEKK